MKDVFRSLSLTALALSFSLGLSLSFSFTAARAQGQPQPELPLTDLYVGMHRLQTELAIDPRHRSIGMMWRQSMPENRAMLFVFEDQAIHCFWMRNTLVPLSIAFLRDDGSIVNIRDMQPQQDTQHCPEEPVRYALEVNQGWFDKRNIKPNHQVRDLPAAPATGNR